MSLALPPSKILLDDDSSVSIPPEPLQPDDDPGLEVVGPPEDHGAYMQTGDASSKSVNLDKKL